MTEFINIHQDFYFIKESIFDKINLNITELHTDKESQEYGACTFILNDKKIIFRTSKITPTKIGQFVTLWKRNKKGITTPFNLSDDIDFIIISASSNDKIGIFIFPKTILIEKGIISTNKKEGKRGIRVYPPWDVAKSNQAEKTQHWQTEYFVYIKPENLLNHIILKELKKINNLNL